MQVTQAEAKNRRVGVEEEFIKFRPSPNFKNMKKFFKLRGDYTETNTPVKSSVSCSELPTQVKPQAQAQAQVQNLAQAQPRPQPQAQPRPQALVQTRSQALVQTRSQPQTRSQTHRVEQKKEVVKPALVQPPLPPYPPPPDSPSPLDIKIKQEKIEDEKSNPDESMDTTNQTEQIQPQTNPTEERPKKTICKEFIRGNCKRPVCKFAHEVDVSQLAGVFTFCWNYQNDVCTYPNCRFVHATVFEEAEFYRTGVLPPHARSHLKKQAPPPPPPPPEKTQIDMPPPFANPRPPLQTGVDKSLVSCKPASAMDERPVVDDFKTALPCSTSPLKREWSDIDDFSSSPRDLKCYENLAKKCNTCEITDFRLQYNQDKYSNMLDGREEFHKKMAQLTKKANKLSEVLLTLIKPALHLSKGGASNGSDIVTDKALREQITTFATSNHRFTSLINEDTVKFIFNSDSQLTTLMATLFGDRNTTPDNCREA